MINAAINAARSKAQSDFAKEWRVESLEWLLTFDTVVCDKGGMTFGACLYYLPIYGVDVPSQERVKEVVVELCHNAGFEVEWNKHEPPAEQLPLAKAYEPLGEIPEWMMGEVM
jgi:hypothetical protein